MIPKEKIKNKAQQLGLTSHGTTCFKLGVRFAESELSKPTLSPDTRQNLFNYFEQEHGIQLMVSDFHEIENYVKPEIKGIELEFAEWCGSEGWIQEVQANNWKNVLDIKIPELVRMTTSELFDKFMAERG